MKIIYSLSFFLLLCLFSACSAKNKVDKNNDLGKSKSPKRTSTTLDKDTNLKSILITLLEARATPTFIRVKEGKYVLKIKNNSLHPQTFLLKRSDELIKVLEDIPGGKLVSLEFSFKKGTYSYSTPQSSNYPLNID